MNKMRVVYSLCMLMTMASIFAFSSQTYKQTMKTSDVIVKPIENSVRKDSANFETDEDEKSYLKKLESKIDAVVRKSAHMLIYGVLAVFVYLLCKSFGISDGDAIILTLAVCALYGGSDELHQRFVRGRTSRFSDVCVDETGAAAAMTVMRIVHNIVCTKSK